jgi:hypothetical protein
MQSHDNEVAFICRNCGKGFELTRGRLKSQSGKFCSLACANEAQPKDRVLCGCETCGKEFWVGRSRFERGKARFCSKPCMDQGRTIDLNVRFWSQVDVKIGLGDQCWEWLGNRLPIGYGVMRLNAPRRYMPAHRVAWLLTHSALPIGLDIHHMCENKGCVNPGHLEAISRKAHMGKHRESFKNGWKKRRRKGGGTHGE